MSRLPKVILRMIRKAVRRHPVAGVTAIVVLLALTLIPVWLFTRDKHTVGADAQTSNHPPLSAAGAARIENAMESDSKQEQASVLSPAIRQAYLDQDQALLPGGADIIIKPGTFKAKGDIARAEAEVKGMGMFILHFGYEEGKWLILYTEQLQ